MNARKIFAAVGAAAWTYSFTKMMRSPSPEPILVYEGSKNPLDQARISQERTRRATPFGPAASFFGRPIMIIPGDPPAAPIQAPQPGKS